MRLAVLANRYPVESETFIAEPVAWLRALGHDVAVVAGRSSHPGEPPTADTGRPALAKVASIAAAPLRALRLGARVARLGDRAGLSFAETLFRATLPAVGRAERWLAHFGDVGASWLPVAALLGKPLAVYFHGYDASRALVERPAVYRALFASGTTLLTNSEHLRRRLIASGAPVERFLVVPLAAAPAFFEARRAPERLVLTVARLVPKKGLGDAIAAFAGLPDDWRYEIIGDGPLRAELGAAAAAHGVAERVVFRGAQGRPAVLGSLERAAIFLLPSKRAPDGDEDGTPVSILEAAAAGVPVVATRQAGIPEILPPDEGFVVPPGDIAAIAGALGRLVTDEALRRDWGERCRAHARARHTPEQHLEALLAALAGATAPRVD